MYIGSWGIPLLITIILVNSWFILDSKQPNHLGGGIASFVGLVSAVIVSLVSWLIWALVR